TNGFTHLLSLLLFSSASALSLASFWLRLVLPVCWKKFFISLCSAVKSLSSIVFELFLPYSKTNFLLSGSSLILVIPSLSIHFKSSAKGFFLFTVIHLSFIPFSRHSSEQKV